MLKPLDETNLDKDSAHALSVLRRMQWEKTSLVKHGSSLCIGCDTPNQSPGGRVSFPIDQINFQNGLASLSHAGIIGELALEPVKKAYAQSAGRTLSLSLADLSNLGIEIIQDVNPAVKQRRR